MRVGERSRLWWPRVSVLATVPSAAAARNWAVVGANDRAAPPRRSPIVVLLLVLVLAASACDGVPFGMGRSANRYRVPYADGTEVEVRADAQTHDPPGAYDLRALEGWGLRRARVVAAADGIVRFIVDGRTRSCDCEDGTCGNNYVWIEHANGEWSKYTHLATGSVTGKAGLAVGDEVAAGTFLGYESDVGDACGVHLHFEVVVPDEPGRPRADPSTGWLEGERVVPRFCGVGGGGGDEDVEGGDGVLREGDEVEAGGCG